MGVMTLRSFWTFLIGIVMYYRLYAVLDHYLQPRFPNKRIYLALITSAAFVLKYYLPVDMHFVASTSFYLLIVLLCYRNKLFAKFLSFCLLFSIMLIVECMTVVLISVVGWTYNPNSLASVMTLDVITASIYVLLSLILIEFKFVLDDKMDKRLRWKLMISSFFLLMLTACIYLNSVAEYMEGIFTRFVIIQQVVNVLGLFLPLFSLVALFSLIHQLNLSMRETEAAHLREVRAQMELEHHQTIAEKSMEYRRLRHDLKNHLLTIDALGQSGDLDRQHAYIAELGEAFSKTALTLSTGHLLIDSILQSKAKRMEAANIRVQWQLSPLPSALEIEDLALCSLLGNILDNAIEACERIADVSKHSIQVSMQIRDAHFVFQVINSAENVDGLLRTMFSVSQKKKQRAGLGLTNCQRIVDHYHGFMNIIASEDRKSIEVSVVLPCVPKIY